MSNETKIVTAESGKQLIVTRTFDAPLSKVWNAWTDATELDKWWAPKPYKASTKEFDFSVGGHWLYAMEGPQGDRHWSMVKFTDIEDGKNFRATNFFSDENGNKAPGFPEMEWFNAFAEEGSKTLYTATLTFPTEEALNNLVDMGFKGGFTMGLNNLEEIL